MTQFTPRNLDAITDVACGKWRRIYGEAAQNADYFRACEQVPPPEFRYSAVAATNNDALVAGAPTFETHLDLGLVLDNPWRKIFELVRSLIPAIGRIPIIGLGSPHCHESGMAFDATLATPAKQAALGSLVDALEQKAKANGARILLVKDVPHTMDHWAHDVLAAKGYARITALPVSTLTVPADEDEYFKSISGNMRSNLRRRLKRARNVRVEIRSSADGLADRLNELHDLTTSRGSNDYDQFAAVHKDFYDVVAREMPDNARLLTYWLDQQLIGFAMVLLGPNRMIQNYNGMCYPEGPDNGLFYLDWMTQLRLCMDNDIAEMQSGVTTYLIKSRLGSKFHRSYVYVRHVYSPINAIIRALSSNVNLEKDDPGLKELGDAAPFVTP